MKTTFWKLALFLPVLLLISVPALADDECFSDDDVDSVLHKTGLAYRVVGEARHFFELEGDCLGAVAMNTRLKLSRDTIQVYEVDLSMGGVPEDMSPEEMEDYIFYYCGDTGLVSAQFFDSRTRNGRVISERDSKNMAQSSEAEEHYMLWVFELFARDLANGGNVEDLINQAIENMASGPNDEATTHMEVALRHSLNNFAEDIEDDTADASFYAYVLGRFRAAVRAEHQDARDKITFRLMKFGY